MEEGSLRVDANVSVRPSGVAELGTRCEIKNVNSLRSLGRAIDYEARRQIDVLTSGGRIALETRHWHEDEGRTVSGRTKEEAEDYRYFPEPDLVPVDPDPAWRAAVRGAIPVLPAERRERLAKAAGVDPADVAAIVAADLDELVVGAIELGADARIALNRAANEVAAALEAGGRLSVADFADLCSMEADGRLTATQAKQVLTEMLATGGHPSPIAEAHGFRPLDTSAVADAVDAAIAADPGAWARYCAGEDKVAGVFVGAVMKATGGKADGKAVTALLRERRGRAG
jgi:aspartyl-tRNA(Asn)/glutamyl-tRNA(Gln) amidotransferase subunit B